LEGLHICTKSMQYSCVSKENVHVWMLVVTTHSFVFSSL
jgi:hypothetical protein